MSTRMITVATLATESAERHKFRVGKEYYSVKVLQDGKRRITLLAEFTGRVVESRAKEEAVKVAREVQDEAKERKITLSRGRPYCRVIWTHKRIKYVIGIVVTLELKSTKRTKRK